MGTRSAQPDQIGAHAIHRGSKTALGNHGQRLIIQGDAGQAFTGLLAALAQSRLRGVPTGAKALRIGVKVQAPTNDFTALGRLRQAAHGHIQAKAIEQLRAQLAFFRIHGADQHKTGGVAMGDAIALDHIGAAGRHVQ